MTLKESLETINDSRIDRCKKHSLVDILMIVFSGILCGYKSIEAIQLFAELSENMLKKYLGLANGIPSADTILRVLAKIEPEQLGRAFIKYAKFVFGSKMQEGEVIALDGKTGCSSEYSPATANGAAHKAIHMASAWVSRLGMCFGQVKAEEKSNEITAVPELLDLLDLKVVIVTIDAMCCQKKIAGKITEKKSDYMLSLKGKQGKMHDDVREFFTGHELDEKYCERYRIEKYESEVEAGHGRVENGLHWKLDVVFGEDLSRLRKDNSAANMNIIRRLDINTLKQTDFSEFTRAKNLSIVGRQMLCNKREECIEKVIRNL